MGEMKRFLLNGLGAIAGFMLAALGWLIISMLIALVIGSLYPRGHSDLSMPSEQSSDFFCLSVFLWPWIAMVGLYLGWLKTEAYLDKRFGTTRQKES